MRVHARLVKMPFAFPLVKDGMRQCQVEAITGLVDDRPRALIQVVTGAGKTFTGCAFAYRLVRQARARRVLLRHEGWSICSCS